MNQEFLSLVYIPPQKTTLIKKDTYIPMFIAALFIIAKMWKQRKYQHMNGYRKYNFMDVAYTTSQP